MSSLPGELRGLYGHTSDLVQPAAYGSFNPPRAPWRLCFVDSYEGNAWRLDVREGLERLTTMYQQAGKLTGGLQVAVSNNDSALESSQIRAFVDKGCSAILAIVATATGDNAAIKAAHDRGVPFITLAGAATSPDAINVDSNWYVWGRDMAQQIADRLHGQGTVIMVKGIEGQPVAVGENQGALGVWQRYPGLKVIQTNGNWTPAVTKSAVLQVLASHPEKIDAVWTTGSELRFVAEAFQQAGRPVPIVTGSVTGDALAYAKQHPGTEFLGNGVLPWPTAETAFRVAMRVLEGQRAKISTMMVPLPTWSSADLDQWYRPCMTTSSVTPFPVPPASVLSEQQMSAYFSNGQRLQPPFDYRQATPDPCG